MFWNNVVRARLELSNGMHFGGVQDTGQCVLQWVASEGGDPRPPINYKSDTEY